jgi:hypothetical protein
MVCVEWIHLTTWPTPSSRLHKADLLESYRNPIKEYNERPYNVEIYVSHHKVVRPVKPLREARPGGLLRKVSFVLKLGIGKPEILRSFFCWEGFSIGC